MLLWAFPPSGLEQATRRLPSLGLVCFPSHPQDSSVVPFKMVPVLSCLQSHQVLGQKGVFLTAGPVFLSHQNPQPDLRLVWRVQLPDFLPGLPLGCLLLPYSTGNWVARAVLGFLLYVKASFLASFSITLWISRALSLFPNKVYFLLFWLLHWPFQRHPLVVSNKIPITIYNHSPSYIFCGTQGLMHTRQAPFH